jgi:hypothetical protein
MKLKQFKPVLHNTTSPGLLLTAKLSELHFQRLEPKNLGDKGTSDETANPDLPMR